MTNNTSQNASDTSQGDNQSPPSHGDTSTSQGDTSTTTQRTSEELEQLNAKLMRENADYRRRIRERDEAAQATERKRLEEQGEFKALAEQHATRVRELEPKAQELDELSNLLGKQVKAQMKDWPQEVKDFYPGDDAPIKQRLEWLDKSRALVEKLTQQARGAVPGMRPNPPAQGQPTREDLVAANMAAMRKDPRYKGVL